MPIRTNIVRVKKNMLTEVDEPTRPFSNDVQRKALAAIRKGLGTAEWEAYMKLFVDDPTAVGQANSTSARQLARLMGNDNTENDLDFDARRAYLVADGTCTTETALHFGAFASETLDLGL